MNLLQEVQSIRKEVDWISNRVELVKEAKSLEEELLLISNEINHIVSEVAKQKNDNNEKLEKENSLQKQKQEEQAAQEKIAQEKAKQEKEKRESEERVKAAQEKKKQEEQAAQEKLAQEKAKQEKEKRESEERVKATQEKKESPKVSQTPKTFSAPKSSGRPGQFSCDNSVVEGYNLVRNDSSDTEWVVFSYSDSNIAYLSAQGNGGISEMAKNFKDDERAYGFIRVISGDSMSKRSKFILFAWIGPKVTAMKRAKASTDRAVVKGIISDFALEIHCEDQNDLSVDSIMQQVKRVGGADYG